jgi:hypothetical protein
MDQLRTLSTGAKIVLGGAIAFLIVSFFTWFEVEGFEEATGVDAGISMWHGVGVIAGLLAIALLVWQAIRVANINIEIGVTPAMVSAALAILLLIFAFIRFISTPTLFERTFWAWLGLALAIVIAVGSWMNMKAAGESLADVRGKLSGVGGGAAAAGTTADQAAAAAPAPPSAPQTVADAAQDAIVEEEPPKAP